MRPDEHKKKKSAQYKKKHAISDKHGEKTKKSSSETLKKTYDDNSVSFPSNFEGQYTVYTTACSRHRGLLPLKKYIFSRGSTFLCSRKKYRSTWYNSKAAEWYTSVYPNSQNLLSVLTHELIKSLFFRIM